MIPLDDHIIDSLTLYKLKATSGQSKTLRIVQLIMPIPLLPEGEAEMKDHLYWAGQYRNGNKGEKTAALKA